MVFVAVFLAMFFFLFVFRCVVFVSFRRCGHLFVNICCCMICSGNEIFKELETQFSQTPTRPERVAADHIGYTGPRAIGGSLTDREFLSGSLSVF